MPSCGFSCAKHISLAVRQISFKTKEKTHHETTTTHKKYEPLTNCPNCGQPIDKNTPNCEYCGTLLQNNIYNEQ